MTIHFGQPVRLLPVRQPPGCLARVLAWLAGKLRTLVIVGLIFGAGYGCRALMVR